jgi:hypothetical protein
MKGSAGNHVFILSIFDDSKFANTRRKREMTLKDAVLLELNGSLGTEKCGFMPKTKKAERLAARYKGVMAIFGPPQEPIWSCGTDMVWPCIDDKLLKEIGYKKGSCAIFVCRHMIVSAD